MKIPILRLKGILLTSIQVDLTDEEALGFQDDVLRTASVSEAAGIVIDITTLDVVDSFMARVLTETANMLQLLGTEVVVCGMQPSVALTLVQMDRELVDVQTALNLDQAFDKVQQLIAARAEGRPVKHEGNDDE